MALPTSAPLRGLSPKYAAPRLCLDAGLAATCLGQGYCRTPSLQGLIDRARRMPMALSACKGAWRACEGRLSLQQSVLLPKPRPGAEGATLNFPPPVRHDGAAVSSILLDPAPAMSLEAVRGIIFRIQQ